MPSVEHALYLVSIWALPLILAITFHEAAHGFAAWRLGDDTAWRQGRVTFNPVRHIDPFGTLLLPGLLLTVTAPFGSPFVFGYAKPVPVAFGRLRNPRWGMILVAGAGPATNIVLALACALLLHTIGLLPRAVSDWALANLKNAIWINVILAVFNLLPLPPLDGGRILVGLLPYRMALLVARLERYGLPIIVGLLFLLPLIGRQVGTDLDLLTPLILIGAARLAQGILFLSGFGIRS